MAQRCVMKALRVKHEQRWSGSWLDMGTGGQRIEQLGKVERR